MRVVIDVGRRVEIRPAYNSDTGERDVWDEIAGCEGLVIGHGREGTGEHIVLVGDGEWWIHVARLRDRRAVT